jgi:hypothetical protein
MLYWDVLLKSVQKIQVWLKTGQKYITWKILYMKTYIHLWLHWH